MNIDSIQNGIVLDHITAGKALQIYNDLHLDKLDCSVAIIKNVKSEKMGRKNVCKYIQHPERARGRDSGPSYPGDEEDAGNQWIT